VIGYSGLDQELLRLLSDSGNHLRSLFVVSESIEAAERTTSIITKAIGLGLGPGAQVFPDGFGAFAQGESLRSVMALLP
jgi:hypothetical protein